MKVMNTLIPIFATKYLLDEELPLMDYCCIFAGDVSALPNGLFVIALTYLFGKISPTRRSGRIAGVQAAAPRPLSSAVKGTAAQWLLIALIVAAWRALYSLLRSFWTMKAEVTEEEESWWPVASSEPVLRPHRLQTDELFPASLMTLLAVIVFLVAFLKKPP